MKKLIYTFVLPVLLTVISCKQNTEPTVSTEEHKADSIYKRKLGIENTLRMQDNFKQDLGVTGNSGWYCPDNVKGFPPVDIKFWNTVRIVNGRLPTFEETQNGTSLIYYDTTNTPDAKPYKMFLPKLASFYCNFTKKVETVIVIQIVQTATDTVVGYRFLTGGNGTGNFREFHFLTDDEVKKVGGSSLWNESPKKRC